MTKPRKKPARTTKPRRKLRRLPAGAGGRDDAVAAAAEQLRTNPLARSVYQQLQARYVGPDPLAVGGCEWPDTLTSGQVLHVAESEPLLAWRMWSVAQTPRGPPRRAVPHRRVPRGPVHPGGVVAARHQHQQHLWLCVRGPGGAPAGQLRCGIRAVQSLSVLRGVRGQPARPDRSARGPRGTRDDRSSASDALGLPLQTRPVLSPEERPVLAGTILLTRLWGYTA